MGIVMTGRYAGKKLVETKHEPSGVVLKTDAPKDSEGEGSTFSPTDLVGASLGACMLTIIANVCARSGLDLTGAHYRVEKVMSQDSPRRIAALPISIHLPARFAEEDRLKFERSAMLCPVKQSLHPDVDVRVEFVYDVA